MLLNFNPEISSRTTMSDPAIPPPSSPTISSVSSSDLDTESTGSFFHDRSITLGSLMGVTFPALTIRVPSQSRHRQGSTEASRDDGGSRRRRGKKARKKRIGVAAAEEEMHRRWRWWRFCRDDIGSKPASLGEFLEAERRFGDVAFYGVVEAQPRDGRGLFADGRVLPPAAAGGESGAAERWSCGACKFSVVSLSGIWAGAGAGCVR